MQYHKILLFTAAQLFAADSDWYNRKLEGWYYFHEGNASEADSSWSGDEAHSILEDEKRQLQESLSLALLNPTKENIASYISQSQKQIERSSEFADAWGQLLSEKRKKEILQTLSKTHFLLFCFRSQDDHSKQAAESAIAFAEGSGWKFKALSLDGAGIEGLESFEKDQGMAQSLGIQSAPSFYAVNPENNKAVLLGLGNRSPADLEEAIALQFGDYPDE